MEEIYRSLVSAVLKTAQFAYAESDKVPTELNLNKALKAGLGPKYNLADGIISVAAGNGRAVVMTCNLETMEIGWPKLAA